MTFIEKVNPYILKLILLLICFDGILFVLTPESPVNEISTKMQIYNRNLMLLGKSVDLKSFRGIAHNELVNGKEHWLFSYGIMGTGIVDNEDIFVVKHIIGQKGEEIDSDINKRYAVEVVDVTTGTVKLINEMPTISSTIAVMRTLSIISFFATLALMFLQLVFSIITLFNKKNIKLT